MAQAARTSVVWGFAFVANQFALESFTAPQLTVARFLVACLPVLVLPRPAIPWQSTVAIGLTQAHSSARAA